MKTVIIGAGSAFGSKLSVDILSRQPLQHSTIALCDLDATKLEQVRAYVQRVIDHHKLPANVIASTDRMTVLPDADFVIIAISVGGPAYHGQPYSAELDIPAKYGIRQLVGDTVGPGGIFRGLRTAPVLLEIMRNVSQLAPRAMVLNYTNPMAILTWVMSVASPVPIVGLCHGVQGTSKMLASIIGAPYAETSFWVAGINHMAWFLRFRHKGEDAYPLLWKFIADPSNGEYREARKDSLPETVRFEIMRRFGYFCTESPMHCAEYMPYFREKNRWLDAFPDLRHEVEKARERLFAEMGVKASAGDGGELVRTHEYAPGIMEAAATDQPFRFNGNVMNDDLISNLPHNCCVEVPCMADREGVHPCRVGDLPEQCAALCRTNVNVQALTAKAILDRDREAAFHALLLDPITAATCSMDQIRSMFEEMWAAEAGLLDYYN